jgi:formyl-CoA transferase
MVQSKALGMFDLLAQPIAMSRTPSKIATPAPEYGEHNDEVLAELGYMAEEIEMLRKKEVI